MNDKFSHITPMRSTPRTYSRVGVISRPFKHRPAPLPPNIGMGGYLDAMATYFDPRPGDRA